MQTELLHVTGMTCGACIDSVTKALKAIDGVGDVGVSLAAGEVTVQFDERQTSLKQLKSALESAGYPVAATNAAHSHTGMRGCCG